MSNFTTPLDSRNLDGTHHAILASFSYHVGGYPSPTDDIVTVLRGFITDFGSNPRITRVIWSPSGRILGKPSVVHDWGYAIGDQPHESWGVRGRSRKEWDDIFYEGMKVMAEEFGNKKRYRLRAWLMYRGVRAGGWWAWRQHRRRQAEAEEVGMPYPQLISLDAINDLSVANDLETME